MQLVVVMAKIVCLQISPPLVEVVAVDMLLMDNKV